MLEFSTICKVSFSVESVVRGYHEYKVAVVGKGLLLYIHLAISRILLILVIQLSSYYKHYLQTHSSNI